MWSDRFCFPCLTDRSRLTWRTPPSTTSSARSSSRSSGTWGNLARRCWACPARASPLTTGACRQGRATAPPTALWPYCPWTLTARKRRDHLTRHSESHFIIHLIWPVFLRVDGWCHWWHYQPGVQLQRWHARPDGSRTSDGEHGMQY